MRKAAILQQAVLAGILEEIVGGGGWRFTYEESYSGRPVSLTMPLGRGRYEFSGFPPVFEGLLPEGEQLEAMLRRCKIDRHDFFGQLIAGGQDLVGSLTVQEIR